MASLRNYALAIAIAFTTSVPRLVFGQSQTASRTSSAPASTSTAAHRQCYLPNGNLAGDVPCDPNAEHSMCCKSPDHCLSNGLCLDVDDAAPDRGNMYARGTCTDQTWHSDHCPDQCKYNEERRKNSSAVDWSAGGVMVWGCNKAGYGAPAAYCCESVAIPQECCKPTAMFSLQGATIGNALPIQTYPSPLSSNAAAPTDASSSSSTITGAGGGLITSPPASSDVADSGSLSLSDGAKIGLGVGIGIGGALVIIGFVFLYFYRRAHPASKSSESQHPESNTDPNNNNGNNNPHNNNNPDRSPSVVSAGSGVSTVAAGGGHGVWVDGRFYPSAGSPGSNPNAGVVYAKVELESHKDLKELDGTVRAREIATWEHTPAELPVDNGHGHHGWGVQGGGGAAWEESGRVGAQEVGGEAVKGGAQVQVGEVSPLSPAPVKPAAGHTYTTLVPVGDEQTLPAQSGHGQGQGEKYGGGGGARGGGGGQDSRWEGITRSRLTGHGNGTG